MKLFVQREPFLAAAQRAAAACPSKDVKPVLKNLHVRAAPGVCELSATDLEVGIRCPAEGVEVHEEGECLLPANTIVAVLKECREATVEIVADADADSITLTAPGMEFGLPYAHHDEFPTIPGFPAAEANVLIADAQTLASRIERVVFCVAQESQRYSLTGVLWEVAADRKSFALVATDGRRLAVCGQAPPAKIGPPVVVPVKAMNMLAKLLRDVSGDCRVALRPNEAMFEAGGTTLYSRLVEGVFPEWRNVLPKTATHRLTLDADTLLRAVKQASISTDKEAQRVTFAFSPGKLTLTSTSANNGKGRVDVATDYDGTVEVNLNPAFVLDLLRILDGEVTWEMTDGAHPVTLRAGEDWKSIVMPLT